MPLPDMDKFRLRRFVEKLDDRGELETHEAPIDFAELAAAIENCPKAILFKSAGPESQELVANVNGSRSRIAIAMDVQEKHVVKEFQNRMANPQPVVDVDHEDAPVQRIVLEGDEADLTKLPFYLQHHLDGAAYLSAGIDYSVDPETGTVTILRYTASQDVGRAIHPSYVEGQMQGGVAQGVGWALNEELIYGKTGCLDNAGFLDYRIPVASDLPVIDTVMVENPNPGHPHGVKGVGEVPIVPALAAIANAIANATGKRLYELPMSPPKILKVLGE